MPSYAQLEQESWWRREYEPPNLRKLTDALRAHYHVGFSLIGAKGDNEHTSGYHRSREWILNSQYSNNGSSDYSVQHSLDRTGDPRWLCAIDFQTGTGIPALVEVCKRLDAAVRADQFPQIREWYGNLGGDQIVDGWNNVTDRPASADSSHLFHLHISFFRSRADWDHSQLLAVLTGDDVALSDTDAQALIWRVEALINNRPTVAGGPTMGEVNQVHTALAELELGGVDVDALAAALAPLLPAPPTADAIAEAVADEDHRRSEA